MKIAILKERAAGEARVAATPETAKKFIALGNEGAGVPDAIREAADVAVRIPIAETIESLNVAVATGILLFEARRQRR